MSERMRSGYTAVTGPIGVIFWLFVFGFQISALGAATAKPKAAAQPKPSARLIVQRSPNFGNGLVVQLFIDGKKTANIPRDQHYGGTVSAGRHTITVLALPNTQARRATSVRLAATSGKVYIYTAGWASDRLVLQPSTVYTPTQAVKPLDEKPAKKRHAFWEFWH